MDKKILFVIIPLILVLAGCIQNYPNNSTQNLSIIQNASNQNNSNTGSISQLNTSNQTENPKPLQITYTSRCIGVNFNVKEEIATDSLEDGFAINHTLRYLCCANISLDINLIGKNITIIEKNTGGACKCECKYMILAAVHGLDPGEYNLKVIGIEFPKYNETGKVRYSGKILVGQGEQMENKTECEKDSDCVHFPSCCHPGAQKCVPKSFAENISLMCKGVPCTMECRPCTTCICKNGKCETVTESLDFGCC